MRLLTLHKILIGAALSFFLFLGVHEIVTAKGSTSVGIGALVLACGVGAYFVWVIRGGYDRNEF